MKCRLCAAPITRTFVDLGTAPPSNAYLEAADLDRPEKYFPLRVKVCDVCFLVQTEDFADAHELFTARYGYFSSTSSSWLAHAEKFVAEAVARFGLDGNSLVTEVAANDGYLLQYVKARNIPCLGIEPTESTAAAAREKGLEIVGAFLTEELGRKLAKEGRQADLVVANNVLAHVPDIKDFARGLAQLTKPEGVVSVEFQHLLRLVEGAQFDTIYHEHFSYLSLIAVARLFSDAGLRVIDVSEIPTHGGSLRVFAAHDGSHHEPTADAQRVLDLERSSGVATGGYYDAFQPRAEAIKDGLLAYLIKAKQDGLRVAAHGAAAKGNTLLNFAGVRPDLLAMVADGSPGKVGRFMPGSRIPIVRVADLLAARPDRILILPWNIADELVAQLAEARSWGAKFVTAVPEIREF
ncbi:MAG: class I SAM-dependent methyltransferase [Pseudomonadota bacterium]